MIRNSYGIKLIQLQFIWGGNKRMIRNFYGIKLIQLQFILDGCKLTDSKLQPIVLTMGREINYRLTVLTVSRI